MWPGNVFGHICMCVCLVLALNSESLDLETLFLLCRHICRILRSSSCINVIASRSRPKEQRNSIYTVPKNVHLFIFQITLSKINQF